MTTRTGHPEGWYYDAPDPSVGIFGGGWVHDDCPLDDGTEVETLERVVSTERMPTGEVTIEVELTCTCGAKATVYDHDWDPGPQDYENEWMDAAHATPNERDPRQVAQELAEFDRAILEAPDDYVPRVLGQTGPDSEPPLGVPGDPTGIDCWEAYEGAGDQG